VAITQARLHPPAREYMARRTGEGKSAREARRCLKRHLANVIYRAMRPGSPATSMGEQPHLAAALT
jgi:hypothetical protein